MLFHRAMAAPSCTYFLYRNSDFIRPCLLSLDIFLEYRFKRMLHKCYFHFEGLFCYFGALLCTLKYTKNTLASFAPEIACFTHTLLARGTGPVPSMKTADAAAKVGQSPPESDTPGSSSFSGSPCQGCPLSSDQLRNSMTPQFSSVQKQNVVGNSASGSARKHGRAVPCVY